jgi:hypothetical protein
VHHADRHKRHRLPPSSTDTLDRWMRSRSGRTGALNAVGVNIVTSSNETCSSSSLIITHSGLPRKRTRPTRRIFIAAQLWSTDLPSGVRSRQPILFILIPVVPARSRPRPRGQREPGVYDCIPNATCPPHPSCSKDGLQRRFPRVRCRCSPHSLAAGPTDRRTQMMVRVTDSGNS